MINIDIKKDIVKLQMQLGKFSKELPFAVAKTLNELALEVRPIVQDSFKDELKIRSRTLLNKGIQINWAQKRDWPFIRSEVGILEEFSFLSSHVTGEERIAKSKFGRAIPQGIKRASSGKVPIQMRPRTLLDRKKAFKIKAKNGKELVVQRLSDKRLPLRVLYGFSSKVVIRNAVSFEDQVNQMFSSRYDLLLGRQLGKAISKTLSRSS